MRRPPLPARASIALAFGLAAGAAGAADPLPPVAPAADPITLDFGLRAGFGDRLGDSAGFPITTRTGGVLGASVAVSPLPTYAIGLGYEHSALGTEHGTGNAADVEVTRALDVLWASLRLAFLRTDRVLLVAQLGPGLAFQHEDASVLVYQGTGGRPSRFTCQDSGAGLGLRAGVGLEARLSRRLWVDLDAVADNLRLSSDVLGSCVPGAGSVSLVGLRLGFTYRLDVSRFLR